MRVSPACSGEPLLCTHHFLAELPQPFWNERFFCTARSHQPFAVIDGPRYVIWGMRESLFLLSVCARTFSECVLVCASIMLGHFLGYETDSFSTTNCVSLSFFGLLLKASSAFVLQCQRPISFSLSLTC